jgi:hypothetical protein
MRRERRYQGHHAVCDRVSTPHQDERRQRNARPDKREDPKQHSEGSAQHDPIPRTSQIRQHRSSSHISSFVPRLFTRIECGGSVRDERIGSSLLALIYQCIL